MEKLKHFSNTSFAIINIGAGQLLSLFTEGLIISNFYFDTLVTNALFLNKIAVTGFVFFLGFDIVVMRYWEERKQEYRYLVRGSLKNMF